MVNVIQLNVGGFDNNFSYLVTKSKGSKEAVLIDATGDLSLIKNEVNKLGLKLVLQLFTHAHPDHCELIEEFKSLGVKTFMPKIGALGEKEIINSAGMEISIIHTPGHTGESVCFVIEGNIFTGDTLFVRGVGTTAYGGSEEQLSNSLIYLSTLDGKLALWPGHNYWGASAQLKTALNNSHLRPSAGMQEKIKKMVSDYESKAGRKKF
jgi:glyoxylase-like metal-dependent hydrolase (beta-lactamase superfamily II)